MWIVPQVYKMESGALGGRLVLAQRHAMKEEKAGHEHANTPTPNARELDVHPQTKRQNPQSSAILEQATDVGFY